MMSIYQCYYGLFILIAMLHDLKECFNVLCMHIYILYQLLDKNKTITVKKSGKKLHDTLN